MISLELLRSVQMLKRESGVRKATGIYRTYSIPGKLQPWFLSLRWKNCLRQNCSLGSYACSEGPALGQNILMMMYCIYFLSVFLQHYICKQQQNYCFIYTHIRERNHKHSLWKFLGTLLLRMLLNYRLFREIFSLLLFFSQSTEFVKWKLFVCVRACVCVCVCVRERERERESVCVCPSVRIFVSMYCIFRKL